MSTSSDPFWLMGIYFFVLIGTFFSALFYLIRVRKNDTNIILSIITLFVIPFIHVVFLLNAVGRPKGVTEFGQWFNDILRFKLWAILIFIAFIFISFWWYRIIKERRKLNNFQD